MEQPHRTRQKKDAPKTVELRERFWSTRELPAHRRRSLYAFDLEWQKASLSDGGATLRARRRVFYDCSADLCSAIHPPRMTNSAAIVSPQLRVRQWQCSASQTGILICALGVRI